MTDIRYAQSLYPSFNLSNENFKLNIKLSKSQAVILMQLFTAVVRTKELPKTTSILKVYLPTIFNSICFNDKNLPFIKEVENTEIGHLFEHIMLEYLCLLKITKGNKKAVFYGNTKWDWNQNPFGSFYIRINCGLHDADIFKTALYKSIQLIQIILLSKSHSFCLLNKKKISNKRAIY